MLAAVLEPGVTSAEKVTDGRRHEDLPIVSGLLDAGGQVHREASDVTIGTHLDLARVHPAPHRQPGASDLTTKVAGEGQRLRWPVEAHHDAIASAVDDRPRMPSSP